MTAHAANRSRRRDRDRARAGLMRAALELSARAPFREVTVAQIATAAGISRSAFYLHYRDKHELLLDATDELGGELDRMAEGWWSADGPPAERVRAGVARLVSLYAENAELLSLLTEVSTYDDEVASGWRALFERLIEAGEAHVRDEQRAGLIPAAVQPRHTVEALVWMTERCCYLQLGRGDRGAEHLVAAQAPVWTAALYPGVIPADQLRPGTVGPGDPWGGEEEEWPPWEQGGTGAAS